MPSLPCRRSLGSWLTARIPAHKPGFPTLVCGQPSHLETLCTAITGSRNCPIALLRRTVKTRYTISPALPLRPDMLLLLWGAIVGVALKLLISGLGIPRLEVAAWILEGLSQYYNFSCTPSNPKECRGVVWSVQCCWLGLKLSQCLYCIWQQSRGHMYMYILAIRYVSLPIKSF